MDERPQRQARPEDLTREFWERKNAEWRTEDCQVGIALNNTTAQETSNQCGFRTRKIKRICYPNHRIRPNKPNRRVARFETASIDAEGVRLPIKSLRSDL